MDLVKSCKRAAKRLAGFIKWVASPEKLPAPEAKAGGQYEGPSWRRRLLMPDPLPRDPAGDAAPARGLLRSIFELETLPRDEQATKAHARPGFIRTLLSIESPPRDEISATRGPSLLRWLLRPEKLETGNHRTRPGRSTDDKES